MDMWKILYSLPLYHLVLIVVLSSVYIVLVIRFCLHVRKLRQKRDTILLLGPTQSGKTALFHYLRDGIVVDTVTSMKEEEGVFPLHPKALAKGASDKKVNVMDIPGHERLRLRVPDFFPITARVVFVVDAADTRAIRPAAEYLYDIFSNAKFNDLAPPILVACNKSDAPSAASPAVLKEALERELTQLKTTRSSLETEGDDDNEQDVPNSSLPVGRDQTPFQFDVDAPCDVAFAACSVKAGNVENVVAFLLE